MIPDFFLTHTLVEERLEDIERNLSLRVTIYVSLKVDLTIIIAGFMRRTQRRNNVHY